MALKIKQNGEVKDLIIPACGVAVLDMEDNFGSSNLEEVLQELGDSDSVYISDETPDKDGIWISSDNTSTVAQENPILVELKDYVNEKTDEIKTTVDSINDKMSEYYSLKEAEAIPENADLNDYVEFGNYQCENKNQAQTLSNCPYTAGGFVLHVERTTGGIDDCCRQTLVCNGDGVTFVRNKISGTWNNWIRVQYMYTELSQLGLTNANTLEEVIKKMANNSICTIGFYDDTQNTILGKQMPCPYGILFINKHHIHRTIVEFNRAYNGTVTVEPVTTKYYCNYNSATERVSEWVAYATSNQISRPNILINGDFQIWQRGTSFTHSHGKYCADRWLMYMDNANNKVTWSKTSAGIKANCTTANTNGHVRIWQSMEEQDRAKLKGLTLTYTIKYKTNSSKARLMTESKYIDLPVSTSNWNTVSYTETYTNSAKWFVGAMLGENNYSMALNEYLEIAYIKVEIGEYATPFVSKTKADELRDCSRYYAVVPISQGVITCDGNTQVSTLLNYPVPMRVQPTATANNPIYFQKINGGTPILLKNTGESVQLEAWKDYGTTCVCWLVNGTAISGLSDGLLGTLNASGSSSNRLSGSSWIALDAEIY